jgi:hypothetical protein
VSCWVDAIIRIREESKSIGAYAIVVDAKNISAKQVYEKFDFIELPNDPFSQQEETDSYLGSQMVPY